MAENKKQLPPNTPENKKTTTVDLSPKPKSEKTEKKDNK